MLSIEPATLDGQPARKLEIEEIRYGEGLVTPVTLFLAHHGEFTQAIFHYGPHDAPEIDPFVRSFTFTDGLGTSDGGG